MGMVAGMIQDGWHKGGKANAMESETPAIRHLLGFTRGMKQRRNDTALVGWKAGTS